MAWGGQVIDYLLLFLAIIFSSLYSGSETGLYAFNPLKSSNDNNKRIQRLIALLKRRDSLVIACLIGNNICIEFATLLFEKICHSSTLINGSVLYAAQILILIPGLFLLAEVMPKSFFVSRNNELLPRLTWFLWLSYIIYFPFVLIMQCVVKMFSWFMGDHDRVDYNQSRQRLKWAIQDTGGGLSIQQSHMVRNVLDLQDRHVASIMRPLKSVDMTSVAITMEELKKKFLEVDSNYLIVYEENIKNIIGVVFISPVLFGDEGKELKDYLVKIPEVSVNDSLTAALSELKKDNLPVAKAVSDNGNILGMVFTRQIIQEIVGDMPVW